jgi:hypothetical protein
MITYEVHIDSEVLDEGEETLQGTYISKWQAHEKFLELHEDYNSAYIYVITKGEK